jgi:hypothetical protein
VTDRNRINFMYFQGSAPGFGLDLHHLQMAVCLLPGQFQTFMAAFQCALAAMCHESPDNNKLELMFGTGLTQGV